MNRENNKNKTVNIYKLLLDKGFKKYVYDYSNIEENRENELFYRKDIYDSTVMSNILNYLNIEIPLNQHINNLTIEIIESFEFSQVVVYYHLREDILSLTGVNEELIEYQSCYALQFNEFMNLVNLFVDDVTIEKM